MARERRQTNARSRTAGAKRGGKSPNEGEGSRSAARDYNRRTARFIQSGRVQESAEQAERAVESGERQELERAEDEGRSHRRS